MKKYSAIQIDAQGVITHFEEKPAKPENNLYRYRSFTIFAPETLELFTTYIAAGTIPISRDDSFNGCTHVDRVKTFQIKGTWFDIGSKESLEEANKVPAVFAKKHSIRRGPGTERVITNPILAVRRIR